MITGSRLLFMVNGGANQRNIHSFLSILESYMNIARSATGIGMGAGQGSRSMASLFCRGRACKQPHA